MMNLSNVRVASKLWVTILGLLVVMLLSNFWVRSNTEAALMQSRDDIQQIERKVGLALEMRGAAMVAMELGIAQFATNENRLQIELEKRFKASVQRTVAAVGAVESALSSDAERAAFEQLLAVRKQVQAVRDRAERELDLEDYNARANFSFGDYAASGRLYDQAFDAFVDFQRAQLQVVMALSDQRRMQSQIIGWVVVAALLLLGVVLARWLVVNINRPLQDAVTVTEAIGRGDLTVKIQTQRNDEFGQLLQALSAMAERLRSVLGEVRQGVDAVSSAASQIDSGNQDLSVRTEQSAASLQQTAASIEEMNASVNQSADTSRQANQLAMTAVQAAERGGEVVQQVVASMEQINTSSRKIGDIIGVIDGIAFQTNILALNAAVEAARAGEQGRGFAVVAGEVRSLAGRSAEAAKEIKTLIAASVSTVEAGSYQVSQAGSNMQEIVSSVRRVTDLMGEITAAAGEQREGFAQVNQAVSNLDQMTQQNAALVEESSAAASAMSEQAQRLLEVVSVFDVGQASTAPAIRPVQAIAATAAATTVAATAPRSAPKMPSVRAPATPAASSTAGAKPAAAAITAKPMPAAPTKNSNEDDWEVF
jgi:methyl-accepting chemotaxis protein